MAYTLSASVAATFNTHLVGSQHYQVVKHAFGASASASLVTSSVGLPVQVVGGDVSLTGSMSVRLSGPVSLSGSVCVAVSAVIPGTGATNLGKAADAVAGATDTGIAPYAIRDDALSALTPAEGDYAPFRLNSRGALWTEHDGPVSLTGSIQIAGFSAPVSLTGSLEITHSDVHKADFDTGGGTDTTPAFGIAVPASGGAAVVPGDGTAGLKVDLGADNDVVVTGLVSLTGSIQIAGFSAPVSLTGSVQVSGITNPIEVVGDAAHDAAVAGNPLLTGFEARTTNPAAVADGDAVRGMADDFGRQIVEPFGPRDRDVDNHNGSLTLSTTLTLLAAGAANVFRDLVMITISNPTANDALVTIFDGLAGGTERFRWEFAANGGGIALAFTRPFKQATAANGWSITSSEVGVGFTVQAVERA